MIQAVVKLCVIMQATGMTNGTFRHDTVALHSPGPGHTIWSYLKNSILGTAMVALSVNLVTKYMQHLTKPAGDEGIQHAIHHVLPELSEEAAPQVQAGFNGVQDPPHFAAQIAAVGHGILNELAPEGVPVKSCYMMLPCGRTSFSVCIPICLLSTRTHWKVYVFT